MIKVLGGVIVSVVHVYTALASGTYLGYCTLTSMYY